MAKYTLTFERKQTFDYVIDAEDMAQAKLFGRKLLEGDFYTKVDEDMTEVWDPDTTVSVSEGARAGEEVPPEYVDDVLEELGMVYWVILCYNGSKRQVAGSHVYRNEREWRIAGELLPYDIIDEDDRCVWFDCGDR